MTPSQQRVRTLTANAKTRREVVRRPRTWELFFTLCARARPQGRGAEPALQLCTDADLLLAGRAMWCGALLCRNIQRAVRALQSINPPCKWHAAPVGALELRAAWVLRRSSHHLGIATQKRLGVPRCRMLRQILSRSGDIMPTIAHSMQDHETVLQPPAETTVSAPSGKPPRPHR